MGRKVAGELPRSLRVAQRLCLSVLLALGSLFAQTASFFARGNFAAGTNPSAFAVGDFNGDGQLDLAVASGAFSSSVSVLLSLGSGAFQSPRNFPVGDRPRSIAVADLNGDGTLDLVVANSGSDNISVLLGLGSGAFQLPLNFPAGKNPRAVAVGDFNGDGKLDLAVVNTGSDNVSVLLGVGSGIFRPPLDFAVGNSPRSIAVADFNSDGKPDLAVANGGTDNVSVLLGLGDGLFRPALNFPAGGSPAFLVAGDFNGDGQLDIAVANARSGDVSVLLGLGSGFFRPALSFAVGTNPSSIAVGDFNGDGKPDLAVANAGSANVSLLLGLGFGTFLRGLNFSTGSNPSFVAVGDFSGDGTSDLVVANAGSNDVLVLLNSSPRSGPLVATVSAASGNPVVAPESIASLFGSGLSTTTQSAASQPLPSTLGGVTVEVRDSKGTGRLAPLFFVSPTQINFEIPSGTALGQATVNILNGAGAALNGTVQVDPVAPGLFTASGTGHGVAAALATHLAIPTNFQTTSPIFQCSSDSKCVSVPIKLGIDTPVFLSLFGTGIRNRSSLDKVTATINDVGLPVLYAGQQGTLTGLDQVNLAIPLSLRGSGEADLIFTVDGQVANPVRVNIK